MGQEAIVATLILGAMCLLMWWLARLAKRRMGVGAGTVAGSGLRVVGKRPLDQKSALYVIEIAGGRHIIIGASIDGSVSKIDDITPEEYAIMSADEARGARPKLRIAGRGGAKANDGVVEAEAGARAIEAAIDGADADTAATPSSAEDGEATPQFATVGESFSNLLGRAKDARSARRDRRASGE